MAGVLSEVPVPGARAKVQVEGTQGIFFKIHVGGKVVKPKKGFWAVPAKGGVKELRVRGFVPGFQKLFVDGKTVFDLAAGTGLPERLVIFAPMLLIAVNPMIGLVLAVLMFFSNIFLVKNLSIPRPLRLIMPLVNTVVLGALLVLLRGPGEEPAAEALGGLH